MRLATWGKIPAVMSSPAPVPDGAIMQDSAVLQHSSNVPAQILLLYKLKIQFLSQRVLSFYRLPGITMLPAKRHDNYGLRRIHL